METIKIQRTAKLGIRFTPAECAEIRSAAKVAGMQVTKWIREVALRAARGGVEKGSGSSRAEDARDHVCVSEGASGHPESDKV